MPRKLFGRSDAMGAGASASRATGVAADAEKVAQTVAKSGSRLTASELEAAAKEKMLSSWSKAHAPAAYDQARVEAMMV